MSQGVSPRAVTSSDTEQIPLLVMGAGAETSRSADYGSIDEGGEKSSRGSERATSFDSHALGTPEVMTEEEEKTSQARKVLYRSRVLGLLLTVGVLTGITMLLSALEEKGDVNWFGNWGHNRDVHAVTDLGPLRGIYQDAWTTEGAGAQVAAFHSIPYAPPPGRFEPAKLTTRKWTKPRDVRSQGPICPQLQYKKNREFSEDCLTLNVYAPSAALAHAQSDSLGPKSQGSLVPVMVYVHGGRLEFLSNATYEWKNFVASTNQVVVSLNFRMGVLGFLPTRNLEGSNVSGTGGLNGMHDVIVALQWVQQHIHSFGGDPDRVTFAGHSTGGTITCVLGVSPLAAGLFSGLITQSGPCSGIKSIHTAAMGQAISRSLMSDVGAATVEDLQALPVDTLMGAWLKLRSLNPLDPNNPTPLYWDGSFGFIDGWVADDLPVNLYAAGQVNMQRAIVGVQSVDTIIPSHANETIDLQPGVSDQIFVPTREQYIPFVQRWINATFAAYATLGLVDLETINTKVLELYPAAAVGNNFEAMVQFLQIDRDAIWLCPALHIAQLMSASVETHTYMYAVGPYEGDRLLSLGFPKATADKSFGWAGHGAELSALENTLCTVDPFPASDSQARSCFDSTPNQWRLAGTMSSYWKAMSDPPGVLNADDAYGQFQWPQLNASSALVDIPTVVFDIPEVQSVQMGLRAQQCAFWNELTQNLKLEPREVS